MKLALRSVTHTLTAISSVLTECESSAGKHRPLLVAWRKQLYSIREDIHNLIEELD